MNGNKENDSPIYELETKEIILKLLLDPDVEITEIGENGLTVAIPIDRLSNIKVGVINFKQGDDK